MANEKEYDAIHRTTVWSAGAGCHGGCGVKLYVKDGKVVKWVALTGQCFVG